MQAEPEPSGNALIQQEDKAKRVARPAVDLWNAREAVGRSFSLMEKSKKTTVEITVETDQQYVKPVMAA